MEQEDRIIANSFPSDRKYYTLTYPVARHERLSWAEIVAEDRICNTYFYSYRRIMRRLLSSLWHMNRLGSVVLNIAGNFAFRSNGVRFFRERLEGVNLSRGDLSNEAAPAPPARDAA
jgi:hypothetical protein